MRYSSAHLLDSVCVSHPVQFLLATHHRFIDSNNSFLSTFPRIHSINLAGEGYDPDGLWLFMLITQLHHCDITPL